MNIVLYGISRSGKSSFIQRLCKNNDNIKHLTGSETLFKLAQKVYNANFEDLDEEEKVALRAHLISEFDLESNNHKNIIVDGHFSFPNEKQGQFDIVMGQEDLAFYDLFMYMYKPAKLILENAKESNKEQWKDFLKLEENINLWQQYEIEKLRETLKDRGKELVVLNEDLSVCEQYINDVVNGVIKTAEAIAEDVVKEVLATNDLKAVFLLDCDKTLSINDITDFVIREKSIENQLIRDNFKGDFYTQYQSYRFHKHFLKNNIKPFINEGMSRLELNARLINDIKKTNTATIALTLGLADIWGEVNKTYNIFNTAPYLVGKKDSNNIYLSAFSKYLIGKRLKEAGVKVYAVGDSIADIMLLEEADKGWIVINSKLSSSATKYFDRNPNSKICQITYTQHEYKNQKKEKKICLR